MTVKEIIFSILLLVCGFLSGLIWGKILETPYFMLVILAYAVFFGLFLLLVKNPWLRYSVPALSVLLVGYSFPLNKFIIGGSGLGAVFMLGAVAEATKEERGAMKLVLKRVLGPSLGFFFTALALVFAFNYYDSIKDRPDLITEFLPEKVFEVALKLVEVPVSSLLPMPINLNDKAVANALYQSSVASIKNYSAPFANYIPVAAAVSYFLALKAVSVLFYFAALLLIYLLTKLLLATGIIKKILVPADKEILI